MGPLAGIRIVEIASIGPGPFCAMMLADMGADVLTIERSSRHAPGDPLQRSRTRLCLDLKSPAGREAALRIVERADVLIEGYRPGVMERLGLGPESCLERNPRLVYGRMTGWGQTGPLAHAAGHDINYIALSGALNAIGRTGGKPTPPLNLVGDFGGGGMLLAYGLVCALLETQRSGKGQVVDAAMVDGSIALMAMFIGMRNGATGPGVGVDSPGSHLLSGAAHYYDTYETSDGKFVAIGALEPQFFAVLLDKLGLDSEALAYTGMEGARGRDARVWEEQRQVLAALFKTRTREEWCAVLEGSDACFAPVLSLAEAPAHAHNRARGNFIEIDGQWQNAPAPRFSRTPAQMPRASSADPSSVRELLERWGHSEQAIAEVMGSGLRK